MDLDGGAGTYSNAGSAYGTGYCDAQCPRDLKFIAGTANVEGWTPSDTSSNSGVGGKGACCAEMDIWEANSVSTAFTPHTCTDPAYHSCSGDKCGGTYSSTRYAGDCDPDGCDFNPFRQGNESFFGPGGVVDSGSKMTVVTQFVEESGTLAAIKRFYVQNGVVITNSESVIEGNAGYNSITPEFCSSQKTAFGDDNIFSARGGFSGMSEALAKPMVLVMSLWDDVSILLPRV
jgi:cellulose 1,4-beta-cellobiosidase